MFQQDAFTRRTNATTGVLLLLLLPALGASQIESAQTEEPSETIDEIVVHGTKPLVHLKREMYVAEEALYDVYNSLNSDDDYDIHCYKEARTGSKIKQRVCRTEKLGKILAAETQKMMRDEPFVFPKAEIKRMNEVMLAEMTELASSHPDYFKALVTYTTKKQTWESERERRCKGRLFICRRE